MSVLTTCEIKIRRYFGIVYRTLLCIFFHSISKTDWEEFFIQGFQNTQINRKLITDWILCFCPHCSSGRQDIHTTTTAALTHPDKAKCNFALWWELLSKLISTAINLDASPIRCILLFGRGDKTQNNWNDYFIYFCNDQAVMEFFPLWMPYVVCYVQ